MERQKENKEYFRLDYDNRQYLAIIPDVSIVTPTYDRKENLRNMLISLSQQTYPLTKFEVIVVDDGSFDGTNEMVRSLSLPYRLRYFWQEDWSSRRARARNIGINNAQGEIIIFLDSDVLCHNNLVEDHIKVHKKFDNYVLMGSRIILGEGQTKSLAELKNKFIRKIPKLEIMRYYYYIQFLEKRGKASLGLTICSMNTSLHKKHLIALNCFDEKFDGVYGGEDMDLGYRLRLQGLKIYWSSKAIVYHQYHPIAEPVPVYNGSHRNELLLFLKHPEILRFTRIGIWKNKCYGKDIEEIKRLFYEKNSRKEI